mmetsp:Transcript_28473/g.82045  ORF Transcript_28473/g.82045 Transcript_28473/m.82045 type:complete len:122 (-) Transcript_28473:1113-1478(-)
MPSPIPFDDVHTCRAARLSVCHLTSPSHHTDVNHTPQTSFTLSSRPAAGCHVCTHSLAESHTHHTPHQPRKTGSLVDKLRTPISRESQSHTERQDGPHIIYKRKTFVFHTTLHIRSFPAPT